MLAVEEVGQRFVAEVPHDLDLRMRTCESLTDDRVARCTAFPGQDRQLVELAAKADGIHSRPRSTLVAEQRHRYGPSAVHFAQNCFLGAAGIGEEHLVEVRLPRHHLDRTNLDTGLAHVDEEERDATVLRLVRGGARQHEDVVREVALGGPDLLTVDDPLVTVEHRTTAEVAEIAARRRFAVTLAPQVLPAQHLREVVVLLLLGPPLQHGVAEHADTEAVVRSARRDAGPGELLGQHDGFER